MTTSNFVNYGDVNPIEHGGFWIKKDVDTINSYYVVVWNPLNDGTNLGILSDHYIDLNDSGIEWDSINTSYNGVDNLSDEGKLLEVYHYYGAFNCNGTEEICSTDYIEENLKSMGVEL